MRIWIRNTPFSLQIADLRFADWETKENLQIGDVRINNYKFANLQFADWHTPLEICGFAIAE
jgi:hypothetical protein